jgi:hypothetical protein
MFAYAITFTRLRGRLTLLMLMTMMLDAMTGAADPAAKDEAKVDDPHQAH